MVTIANALGNGVPIGVCWARREVAPAFVPGDHATTFGGTPLATAAARAVLAEMQRIDAPRLARAAGARLTERLSAVSGVKEVRGLGLLIAVELEASDGDHGDEEGPDGTPVFPITPEASELRARLARSAALKKRSIEGESDRE